MLLRVGGATACAVLIALACAGACSSEPAADSADASFPDAVGRKAAPTPAPSSSDGTTTGQPSAKAVPKGWSLFTDYDPACGFYVPDDRRFLPEPVRWEPCSVMDAGHGIPGPDGMVCQKMVTDWPVVQGGKLTITGPGEVVDGRARLEIIRRVNDIGYLMVADADGPVHNALLLTGGCGIAPKSMGERNVIHGIIDTNATNGYWPGGAIGGSVDTLRPRVYLPKGHLSPESSSHEYYVGAHYFVEDVGGEDAIYSMDAGQLVTKLVRPPEDVGMAYTHYFFNKDDLFWAALGGAAPSRFGRPAKVSGT